MSECINWIVKTMDAKQAEEIAVLDFRHVSPFTDYFVIASARNHRMAKSIVDALIEESAKQNHPPRALEGDSQSNWLLLDLYDAVIHIFVNEERSIVQLEKLWCDLPRIEVQL